MPITGVMQVWSLKRLKEWLGPLGWGVLLIFFGLRTCDLLNLLCRIYLGRHLSVDDFGAIDPVYSFLIIFLLPLAGVFQIATKSMSRFLALKKNAEYRQLLADMAVVTIIGTCVSSMVILVLKSFILERLRIADGVYIYIIAGLSVMAWWQQFCIAIYQGAGRYGLMILQGLLAAASTLLLTVIFIRFTGLGLLGALLAKAFPSFVIVVMVAVLLKPLLSGPRVRDSGEGRLMKDMFFPVNLYLAGLTILSNIVPLFIRNFIVAHSGGYGALATIGIIPGYVISSVVFVIFPMAAAEHAAGNEINRLYRHAMLIGIVATLLCVCIFAFVSRPLMGLWNNAFVPYAQYVWPYTLVMGLNGMIQVIASVEMARHRYSFLWFLIVPAVIMCCVFYGMRNILTMPIIMMTLVATHVVVLAGMWMSRSRGSRDAGALSPV